MQHDSAPLVNAYAAIEDLLKEVQGYVKVNVHKMADHNICTVLMYVQVYIRLFFIDVQSVRFATCTPACFGTKVLASISICRTTCTYMYMYVIDYKNANTCSIGKATCTVYISYYFRV